MLVADGQFLLLTDVTIQDRVQQFQMHEVFNLPVHHGDVSVKYKISDKYLGITYDKTQAFMITEQKSSTCLNANRLFGKIDAPFQALTKPPTCIMALCTKNDQKKKHSSPLPYFIHPPTFPPM